jgi:hypothetical protein
MTKTTPKTRLNNTYREEIVAAALKDTLGPARKKMHENNLKLAWKLAAEVLTPKGARAMKMLYGQREYLFRRTTHISFSHNGYWRSVHLSEYMPDFFGQQTKVPPAMVDEMLAAAEAEEAFTKRYSRAEQELRALVDQCTTFEALLEVWPDGKAYITPALNAAKGVVKTSTALVSIASINATLGLPKGAQAA